jgi:signal transduction histidine kinase
MIQLVDDLLKTATVESAQFRYNKAPQDIKKIVDDIIRMRKKVAKSKGIILAFKKSKTRMPLISVDQAAIKIVVNNLLENAIAYTPRGGSVNVSIGRTDSALEIHVADTGIGISQEDTDMVFLKFFRGKDAMKMITGGAGLGLYIAKKIIEAHGGTIWVQSQPDKGSTFGVSLPV